MNLNNRTLILFMSHRHINSQRVLYFLLRRRAQLLKWAAGLANRYIIEDDYDCEFRYFGKPIPSLQGFDQNDKVIYLSTFTKSSNAFTTCRLFCVTNCTYCRNIRNYWAIIRPQFHDLISIF